jgi:hypothetical protein
VFDMRAMELPAIVTGPVDAVRFPIWVGPQEGAVLIKVVEPAPAVTAIFDSAVMLIPPPEDTKPIVPGVLTETEEADCSCRPLPPPAVEIISTAPPVTVAGPDVPFSVAPVPVTVINAPGLMTDVVLMGAPVIGPSTTKDALGS